MFTVSASVEDFLQIITALSDATGMEGGEFTPGPGSDLGETSNNSLLKPELSPDLTPGLGQNQALQCTWNGVTVSRAKEPPAVHNSVQGLEVTYNTLYEKYALCTSLGSITRGTLYLGETSNNWMLSSLPVPSHQYRCTVWCYWLGHGATAW